MSASKSETAPGGSILARGGWLIAGAALLLVAAGMMVLLTPKPRQGDSPDPDRAVIDGYLEALRGGADVSPFLGPPAVFDDTPVSEEEAEEKYADYCLRHRKVKVAAVRAGEIGPTGKKTTSPHRFTLVVKGEVTTPRLRVRNRAGEIDPPLPLFITNPDVIVEVKAGKIHGVRTELSRD